jgi:hypothetical protein
MLLILNMVLVLVGPFLVLAPLAAVALVQLSPASTRPARAHRVPARSNWQVAW